MSPKTLVANKLQPFGTTIFSEMTRLAQQHQAVNLSQGFPDFEGPTEIIDEVVSALRSGHNQYARSQGYPLLVQILSEYTERHLNLTYDPESEIVITSGATEAIASGLMGLINPGDEVILFEPYYDSYPASVIMAGGVPKYSTLRYPSFEVDIDDLESLISSKTRAIIINTPHNPTGKVFSKLELESIAQLCIKHDLLVISDEVYEHLTYDDHRHLSIANIDNMKERTLRISSAGKTFSFTGWKIGWAMGPNTLIQAIQAAHQFVTFSTSTPMQVGLANALRNLDPEYFTNLRNLYESHRNFLCDVLTDAGLTLTRPQGTYFVLANFEKVFEGNDREFARHLIQKIGVAAIPPSAFYSRNPDSGSNLIRFAFCKERSTLDTAAKRLRSL
ncbi:MAG: methionine aminotransferase [Myxococcota bacterium]|nr:methionine aminotransferase [Myxococcota bacterium]